MRRQPRPIQQPRQAMAPQPAQQPQRMQPPVRGNVWGGGAQAPAPQPPLSRNPAFPSREPIRGQWDPQYPPAQQAQPGGYPGSPPPGVVNNLQSQLAGGKQGFAQSMPPQDLSMYRAGQQAPPQQQQFQGQQWPGVRPDVQQNINQQNTNLDQGLQATGNNFMDLWNTYEDLQGPAREQFLQQHDRFADRLGQTQGQGIGAGSVPPQPVQPPAPQWPTGRPLGQEQLHQPQAQPPPTQPPVQDNGAGNIGGAPNDPRTQEYFRGGGNPFQGAPMGAHQTGRQGFSSSWGAGRMGSGGPSAAQGTAQVQGQAQPSAAPVAATSGRPANVAPETANALAAAGVGQGGNPNLGLPFSKEFEDAKLALDQELAQTLNNLNIEKGKIPGLMKLVKERMQLSHGLEMEGIDESANDRGIYGSSIRQRDRQRASIPYQQREQDFDTEMAERVAQLTQMGLSAEAAWERARSDLAYDYASGLYENPTSAIHQTNDDYYGDTPNGDYEDAPNDDRHGGKDPIQTTKSKSKPKGKVKNQPKNTGGKTRGKSQPAKKKSGGKTRGKK